MHKPGLNDIKLFLFVQVPAKNYTLLIMNLSYNNKKSKTVGIKYKIPDIGRQMYTFRKNTNMWPLSSCCGCSVLKFLDS